MDLFHQFQAANFDQILHDAVMQNEPGGYPLPDAIRVRRTADRNFQEEREEIAN